jgi:hypothetical protein
VQPLATRATARSAELGARILRAGMVVGTPFEVVLGQANLMGVCDAKSKGTTR